MAAASSAAERSFKAPARATDTDLSQWQIQVAQTFEGLHSAFVCASSGQKPGGVKNEISLVAINDNTGRSLCFISQTQLQRPVVSKQETAAAPKLLARPVRLDNFGRVVWNIPGLVKVIDFSDATIIHPAVGVTMSKDSRKERSMMPPCILALKECHEICMELEQQLYELEDSTALQLTDTVCYKCGLECSSEVKTKCPVCRLAWHVLCAESLTHLAHEFKPEIPSCFNMQAMPPLIRNHTPSSSSSSSAAPVSR